MPDSASPSRRCQASSSRQAALAERRGFAGAIAALRRSFAGLI
jgi:hypothetical protein